MTNMKKATKLITVLLVVTLTFTCVGFSASAATADTVKQFGEVDDKGYGGYLAFGDSLARGCGATENYRKEYVDNYDRTVEGSYPLLVAKAVGCKIDDNALSQDSNYWPICFPGQTLSVTMDYLGIDDGYYDEIYDHGNDDDSFGFYNKMLEIYDPDNKYIEKASLITIGLGLSDIYLKPVEEATIVYGELNAEAIVFAGKKIVEGLEYCKKAYPMLLRYIKEVNPNATVVIVSNYNTGGDVPLTDDILLPVGMTGTLLRRTLNNCLKSWAKKYDCLFCDITNAEMYASQYDIGILGGYLDNKLVNGHLSPEGYAMVSRLILDLLPEKEPTEKKVTKDIVVDLGRFRHVTSVALNGIPLSEDRYSMDGFVITIPCRSIFANNLTITVDQTDGKNAGKTAVYTYQLVYHLDGYRAFLIYGNNDVSGSLQKIVENLCPIKAMSSMVNGINKLLKSKDL